MGLYAHELVRVISVSLPSAEDIGCGLQGRFDGEDFESHRYPLSDVSSAEENAARLIEMEGGYHDIN
jgi:hypothetical protein